MTVETEVASLTSSVNKLTDAVNVQKSTLDASVASALQHKEGAETAISTANSVVAEAEAARDAAQTAQQSANSAVAYQDLTAIDESKSENAVDVFVYDTSKDSDGGAWRNRTQGTSWYNEALNTSTRGATKKFPAVAVIVTDGDELFIYDGDDPSMPMWFKHSIGGGVRFATDGYGFDINTLTAKDGKIFVGLIQDSTSELGVYGGVLVFDYVADTTEKYAGRGSGSNRGVRDGVRFTAWGGHMNIIENDNKLADGRVNDVAVKILPNAPIDPNNGLPVPTIAVATELGVSVIKDDGSIVDITGQAQPVEEVVFTKDNKIACHYNYQSELAVYDIPEADINYSEELALYFPSTNTSAGMHPRIFTGSFDGLAQLKDDFAIGTAAGLCQMSGLGETDNALVNYTTSSYNTGWMNGDIKLATFMDTTAETISSPEKLTNGDFSNGGTGWTDTSGVSDNGTPSVSFSGNIATLTGHSFPSHASISQSITTEVGKTYVLSANVSDNNAYLIVDGVVTEPVPSSGFYSVTFKAKFPTTTITLRSQHQNGTPSTFDDVSVKEAIADRSVNNNGLTVVGNVTKDAVATGAELVGYKFDTDSNKVIMPNASGVGDPTQDYCWMWWQRGTDMLFGTSAVSTWQSGGLGYNPQNAGYFFSYGGSAGSKQLKFYRVNADLSYGNIAVSDTGLDSDTDTSKYNFFCIVKKGLNLYFYVNGKLKYSAVNHSIVGESETTQGGAFGFYESGNGDEGRLALFRISSTAPTAEQIAKIYRDEKDLFQEGAKCTLYGTMDPVNAIAYDEDTELLHAGTSGGSSQTKGRSVFRGLQRVDVSTDQVTTAISAANGLVVEE